MNKLFTLMLDDDPDPSTQGGVPADQPEGTPPAGQPEGTPPVQDPVEPKANPMAQLRTQYDRTKKDNETYLSTLKRIAEDQNITVDELVTRQREEADRTIAQQKGITPEIQKQLREYEDRVRSLETENKRATFNRNAEAVMNKYNLDMTKLGEFVQQAKDTGFDLISNPALDFDVLYRALNYDALLQSREAQVREAVLADIQQKQLQSPGVGKINNPNPGTPTPSTDNTSNEDWLIANLGEIKKR